MHDVRLATLEDSAAIGTTMARAFADDPIWRWLVPGEDRWERRARALFVADVRNRLRLGHVYTTPDLTGAAQWHPPGRWRPSTADLVRELPSAIGLFGSGLVGALRYLARMEKHHPRQPDHWYLAVLGTDPDHQGKGIGSALLQPVLDRCDLEEVPAYLESSKEANIAFYARHGFELRDAIETEGGPTLYPMWREPRR